MKFNVKKTRANIVISIIIFIFTFIVLCICAIDAGYVVLTRYKVQKLTETTALYMTSFLNSKPLDERNNETLKPLKERFEKLYSSTLSGYYNFRMNDIEIKNEALNPKIKVNTEANIPTLFLRYAGIGYIKILQTSYARDENYDMTLIDSDSSSYTFESGDIITDKDGADIGVEYDGDYFIFAGIKGQDNEIFWSDAGYASNVSSKKVLLMSEDSTPYEAYCVQNDAEFDFSNVSKRTIGLVKYIKIYKANCANDVPKKEDLSLGETAVPDIESSGALGGEPGDAGGSGAPVVKVLNSVKLIKKSDF